MYVTVPYVKRKTCSVAQVARTNMTHPPLVHVSGQGNRVLTPVSLAALFRAESREASGIPLRSASSR